MNVRRTLDELGDLAVTQIGFCIGIHWRSVTGSRVPQGMVSARCRLAYVLFSGFAPAYRFHDLRHSCATLLIAQGVHPRVVMEILRHSQISTTMNTYSHPAAAPARRDEQAR